MIRGGKLVKDVAGGDILRSLCGSEGTPSCHLRNGMGVFRQPRELIKEVGEHVELPSASECCGAAGTYRILRPHDSKRILDDKLDQIDAAHLAELLADHHIQP